MSNAKDLKKAVKRAKLLANGDKFSGPEPEPHTIKTRLDLSKAYNWYNYACDLKQMVPWIIEFMKSSGKYTSQQISTYRTVPESRTVTTVGAISRLVNIGAKIPSETLEWAHKKILKTLTYAPISKKGELVQLQYTTSIADRVKQRTSNIIADLEDELDTFSRTDSTEFVPYDYMKRNQIKSVHATKIVAYYTSLQQELIDTISGKDDQLKEAYRKFTKPQLRKYLTFVESIIAAATSISQVNKAVRKPRKPVEKSTIQLISKLKFLKESSQYKIASIDPAKIIRSQSLVVFSTKYKKLGIYVASNPYGLSVKGTTIIGFDPVLSVSKTLRTPEKMLPNMINNSKSNFNKVFSEITSITIPLNGRINEHTILVRIF